MLELVVFVNVRDDFISILSRARVTAHEYTPLQILHHRCYI